MKNVFSPNICQHMEIHKFKCYLREMNKEIDVDYSCEKFMYVSIEKN